MLAGAVVVDRFEVDGLAGAGGMGTVWKARDRLQGGTVALKVLTGTRESERSRFLREAVLLSQLRHPAIVRYVAHGITPSGELFLAMDWLDGEDLSQVLARRCLDTAETLALLGRILGALAVAHQRGIVHRDIKPSNLFLVRRSIEEITLIDFGVARIPRGTVSQTRTETGTIVGTPGYMPPEQVFGDRDLDGRVDIFALGCVVFECMSGRPAFVGDTAAHVFRKILFEDAPRLRDYVSAVPAWLDTLVHRMTAREAEDRPRDASVMARELETGPADLGTSQEVARLRREARLVTVIVTSSEDDRAGALDADAPATPGTSGSPTRRAPRPEVLELPTTGADAVERAVAAARRAAAMREALPDNAVGLVTYRRDGARHEEDGARDAPATRDETSRAATPGGVLLDDETAGLLDAPFLIGRVGRQAVLGDERPESENRQVAGKAMPFVGRDRELLALVAAFRECRDEGVARAALVTGPPGVGKSRLRRELEARVLAEGAAGEGRGATILRARAEPDDEIAGASLLARLLRQASEVAPGDGADVEATKLEARVSRNVASADRARITRGLGRLLEPLGTACDAPAPATTAIRQVGVQDELRRAWEDFIGAECAAGPLLLVLEDLHHADLDSMRLIDTTLDKLRESPLMVIGLGRLMVHDRFPKLWGERGTHDLRLGPLSPRSSARLVRHVLADALDDEATAALVQRAEGNVYALEELLSAAARGATSTPLTVLALAEAELAAVPADGRRVLRAASLFGRTFPAAGVAAVLGDGATAERWLPDLAARGLVSAEGGASYSFRSDLLREAAYETLTRADRLLGRRIADHWLLHGDWHADEAAG